MTVLGANTNTFAELGWSEEQVIGKTLGDLGIASIDYMTTLRESLAGGGTTYFDRDVPLANGGMRGYNFAAREVVDDAPNAGDASTFLLIGRSMAALTHAHSQLAALLMLADLTDDIFVVSDRLGVVSYANAAAARLHGATDFVGRHVSDFVHEDDTGFEKLVGAVLNNEERAEARVLARRGDGSSVVLGVRMIFHPASNRWFTVERDVSETVAQERRLEALAADLRIQAATDELTGVANRTALSEALTGAIEFDEPFAVLLLDMDDFKSVNDTLGHAAGDEFLQCVAQRLQGAAGSRDLVARLGGDEFVVYLPGVGSSAAAEVANRMIESISQPYAIAGTQISRSCSIGVAVRESGEDMSAVLRKADRAAYRAKHEGRSRFVVF